jgi:hypothetical protein
MLTGVRQTDSYETLSFRTETYERLHFCAAYSTHKMWAQTGSKCEFVDSDAEFKCSIPLYECDIS